MVRKQSKDDNAFVNDVLRDLFTLGFSSIKEAWEEVRNPYEKTVEDEKEKETSQESPDADG